MSQIAMTMMDGKRSVHGQPHASLVDRIVAALAAEPETLEELQVSAARFADPERVVDFAQWRAGVDAEPYDAGLCIIDLSARLVVIQSTYSHARRVGDFEYDSEDAERRVGLRYHLSDDWEFRYDAESWDCFAKERREKRNALPPLDARAVLYGELCPFIVAECALARPVADEDAWLPPDGLQWRELPERAQNEKPPTDYDARAEIHARWLMTPRDDLHGRTPRQLLLEKRNHICWDMQDRQEYWSMLKRRAPGLNRESAAFRFGGFGTHENVVYYDLVRQLLAECWARLAEPDAAGRGQEDEVAHLEQAKYDWLHTHDPEFSGQTPAPVIAGERLRLPNGGSGAEAAIDHDCPMCQAMAEDLGRVYFWGLDGSNMDDDFPFSFDRTREEWEKERRDREEFNRKFNEDYAAGKYDKPAVWQRSFSDQLLDAPPAVRLLGMGTHVAELVEDLKQQPGGEHEIETLNRHYGNLREAGAAVMEPAAERFADDLRNLGETHPELLTFRTSV